ncbi:hypothetical protein GCM10020367_23580 [Streptomyces sannanensis]|uniref:DUF4034 domain-containing protein n=1 Tax=Streptomyces sannanensis TaxID=285536 RepID=A0ABP6S9U3_9ACTN
MARARKDFTPVFDTTFGDRALQVAREDIAVGRWQGPAELLHATGPEWDRRTFRVRMLAQTAAGKSVAEHWHTAEPRNPDALVLRAETEVMRAFNLAAAATDRGGVDLERLNGAVRTCLRAADVSPQDPVPWMSLVSVARLFPGGHQQAQRWWEELLARDPHNREAHHQVLRYLSARWHGSHGAMYDFARNVVSSLPPGSHLAVLLQAARAEEYRYRAEQEGPMSLTLVQHWNNEVAVHDLHRTWELWIRQWDGRERAQDVADLNYLLHAACAAGQAGPAGYLFDVLGERATRVPWSFSGDPVSVMSRFRKTMLRSRPDTG